jgi:hypothetical protein
MTRCRVVFTACLLLAAGCRRGPAPVGELAARPAELALGWPQFAELVLEFHPSAALPAGAGRPIVFLHLLDEPGSVIRTFDHPLPGDWQPGKPITDRVRIFQSALAEPLAAGKYILSAGLYDPSLGRYVFETSAREVAKREYAVAMLSVPAARAGDPAVRFSEQWLPPESGTDRQILVSRTLLGDAPGTIQFGPIAGPGMLHLGVRIPGDATPGSRLEVLEGGGQPKLRIASSCGGVQAEVAGPGRFDVDLAVPAGASPVTCEISIDPNFRWTTSLRAEASSARLESLDWHPGPVGEAND